MAWESTDGRLLPLDAAGRFAGECFTDRSVDGNSLRGGWMARGRGRPSFGAWTFRLVDGVQLYRLVWVADKWKVSPEGAA
jgi:hypothetical protein